MMPKTDPYESEILSAFEAGSLKSVATKAELARFRAAARATAIKDRRVNIRLSNGDLTDIQVKALEESKPAPPKTIDQYIAAFPPEIQEILEKIRMAVHGVAPDAQEAISYQIPAFKLNGALVYFAAFKNHIGFYPPIRRDAKLEKAVSPYAGEKGNLRFPLDQPIPYELIEQIVRHRVKKNMAKPAPKKKTRTRTQE